MNLNKTKIIATVGPACSSRSMLSKLISSGVDVFRINFSHATHSEVKKIVSHIKYLRQEHNKHVTILGDLQGPKIRTGKVVEGCVLKKGNQIVFTTRQEMKPYYAPVGGMIQNRMEPGTIVKKNQRLYQILNFNKNQDLPKVVDVFAQTDGLILDNSTNHCVNQGDFVLEIIREKP